MSPQRELIVSAGARVGFAGAGLLFVITVQLTLGSKVAGVLFLAYGAALLMTAIGGAGIGLGTARQVAWRRALSMPVKAALWKSQLAALGTSSLAGLALFAFAYLLAPRIYDHPEIRECLSLMALAIPFMVLARVQGEALRGLGRPIVGQALQVGMLPLVSSLVLIGIGGRLTLSAERTAMIVAVVSFATAVLGALLLHGESRRDAQVDQTLESDSQDPGVRVAPEGGILHLWSFESLILVCSRSGGLILGAFAASEDVARFEIAIRIASIATLVLGGVNAALTPGLVRALRAGGAREVERLSRNAARCSLGLVAPLMVVMPFLGVLLVARTDAGIEGLALALVILGLGELVNAITGPATLLLLVGGEEKAAARAALAATGVLLLVLGLFVPAYGIVGAAAGVACGGSLLNILNARRVSHCFGVSTLAFGRSALNGSAGAPGSPGAPGDVWEPTLGKANP